MTFQNKDMGGFRELENKEIEAVSGGIHVGSFNFDFSASIFAAIQAAGGIFRATPDSLAERNFELIHPSSDSVHSDCSVNGSDVSCTTNQPLPTLDQHNYSLIQAAIDPNLLNGWESRDSRELAIRLTNLGINADGLDLLALFQQCFADNNGEVCSPEELANFVNDAVNAEQSGDNDNSNTQGSATGGSSIGFSFGAGVNLTDFLGYYGGLIGGSSTPSPIVTVGGCDEGSENGCPDLS